MSRQAVFGLDWDGCAEIIKSNDLYQKDRNWLHTSGQYNEHIDKIYQAKFAACHQVFLETISKLARHRINHEVTCASNRQSRYLDKMLQQRFGGSGTNYSALDELKAFADEVHFAFNPILFADKIHEKPKATSFFDEELTRSRHLNIGPMPNFEWDPFKAYTLNHQFEDYAEQGQNIDFFFIDDDSRNKIADALIEYFSRWPDALPDNIHFHMIKFDYQNIFDLDVALEEIESVAAQLVCPIFSMHKNEYGQLRIQKDSNFESLLAPSPAEEQVKARVDWLVSFIERHTSLAFFNGELSGYFSSIKRNIIFNNECNTLSKIQSALASHRPKGLIMTKEFETWYGELCFLSLCETPTPTAEKAFQTVSS